MNRISLADLAKNEPIEPLLEKEVQVRAYELYERFQNELGIGHKGVTPDGVFSLEEVECIGACCWAPAIQVNYAFHDELKPDDVPDILSQYRAQVQNQEQKEKNA